MFVDQLRILIVIDGFFVGGTETQILSTVPDLLREGAHVVVVGADGPLTQSFQAQGCKIFHINFPLSDSVPTSTWQHIESQLIDIIRDENINILHAHQIPSARFVARIAKKRNLPVFFTVHGTYYPPQSLRAALGDNSHIISVSPSIQDWLLEYGIHSTIIPNGIPLEQYTPLDKNSMRQGYSLSMAKPVVVYAGRLAWEKADICISLMTACNHVRRECSPELEVYIAGNGVSYDAVKRHADDLNQKNQAHFITCLGEQLDMGRVFAIADCVVGTGRVALEAMACERAVIAAGCKGMFGLVKPDNYDKALQYHFGDHKADRPISEGALAAAVAGLIASPDACTTLGIEGRRMVESRFNVHDIALSLLEMYRSTLVHAGSNK